MSASPTLTTSISTSRVTPWKVRSPLMEYLSPAPVTSLLVKVISGNSFTLKKSGPRRWSSRPLEFEFTLAASMTISTLDFAASSARVKEPSKASKRPH